MNFLKYFLLAALLHGYPSCSMGQTIDKTIEANYALGLKVETNLIKNPGARKNRRYSTAVGITPTRDTSAGNKINNKASWSIDSTAINDYQEFELIPTPDDLTSGNCGFSGIFKGDGSLYKAQILDGSSNVLAQTVTLTNETGWREFKVWHPCGASGARKVRITQTEAGTAPAINVGRLFYGRMEPGAGVPPNTFTAQVLQAGGISTQSTPSLLSGSCVVTDTSLYTCPVVSGLFTLFPYCDVTPYAATSANATAYLVDVSATQIQVRTYKGGVKDVSEFFLKCRKRGADEIQPAITPAQWDYNWRSYTPTILAASGTFPTYTLNSAEEARIGGKLYVRGKLTFTGTNTWGTPVVPMPSGLTHTGARENVPGKIVYGDTGSNTYLGQAALQGGSNITLGSMSGTNGAGIGVNQASPFAWVSGDTVEWFVGPIDVVGWTTSSAAPQLVGSVTSNFNGALRTVSALFAQGTETTSCTTSPCTVYRNYGGISSVTKSSTGVYAATFTEAFSGSGPICTCSCLENAVAYRACSTSVASTTAVGFSCSTGEATPVGKDATVQFTCIGPR